MQVAAGVTWAAPRQASERHASRNLPSRIDRNRPKHVALVTPPLPEKIQGNEEATDKSSRTRFQDSQLDDVSSLNANQSRNRGMQDIISDSAEYPDQAHEDKDDLERTDSTELHVTGDTFFGAEQREVASAAFWSPDHAFRLDLENSALAGSIDSYESAFEIEQQRLALAERANELRAFFLDDVVDGARRIAPKCYGWKASADAIPGLSAHWRRRPTSAFIDEDDLWRAFRGIQAHEYALEDPAVADRFFAEIQALMTSHDLAEIDPQLLSEQYPWLDVTDRLSQDRKKLFDHPLLHKKSRSRARSAPQTGPPSSVVQAPKPSIARQRLEQDLAAREAKLREELNNKFRANPVPVSSLVPKFKYIMMISGNKTAEMREQIAQQRTQVASNCPKCQATAKKGQIAICKCDETLNPLVRQALDHIKRQSARAAEDDVPKVAVTAANDGKRRRQRIMENERNAGLTNEHTFMPRITGQVPDYKSMQENFNHKLEIRKQMRSKTKPMPFDGLESHEQMQAQKIKERQEREKKRAEQETVSNMPKPTSLNTKAIKPATTKVTNSWKLKVEHARLQKEAQKLIDEMLEQEQQTKEEKRRAFAYKIRARIDKSQVRENVNKTEARRKQFVEDQKRRAEEYKASVEEMQKRISTRMCLFEQEQVDMAKRKAKSEFQRILKESGVDL